MAAPILQMVIPGSVCAVGGLVLSLLDLYRLEKDSALRRVFILVSREWRVALGVLSFDFAIGGALGAIALAAWPHISGSSNVSELAIGTFLAGVFGVLLCPRADGTPRPELASAVPKFWEQVLVLADKALQSIGSLRDKRMRKLRREWYFLEAGAIRRSQDGEYSDVQRQILSGEVDPDQLPNLITRYSKIMKLEVPKRLEVRMKRYRKLRALELEQGENLTSGDEMRNLLVALLGACLSEEWVDPLVALKSFVVPAGSGGVEGGD